MLLVNNIALDTDTPPQLMHADWNKGLHLADLVFPWFLFCVGVAVPFSAASRSNQRLGKLRFVWKAFVRATILVGLGCLVDSAVYHQLTFDMGVLQLIGVAYLLAAIAYQAPFWLRISIAAALMIGYALLIQTVRFPGGFAGQMDENRNIILYINDTYFARYKLDGLLSAIPTAGLVLYGTVIGDTLRHKTWKDVTKFSILVGTGVLCMAVGDIWSVFLAYNKPIWTPSYLLFSGGVGALILAAFYLLVDVARARWMAFPLLVFGSNAILAYVVPIFVKMLVWPKWIVATTKGNLPVQEAFLDWLKGNYGSISGGWVYTGSYIALWWLVLLALYRMRFFVRV
jgi:predicted acyltransferase